MRVNDRPEGGDGGFTLIEVMLTVVLLSIVMGALATAAIVFLRNINETQSRLYVSNSRSLTSRYLVGDIQAAAVYDPAYTPKLWDGVPKGTGTVVKPASEDLPATEVVPEAVVTCTDTPQPVLSSFHYDVFPGTDSDVPNKDRPTKVVYSVVAPPPGDDCQLVRTKSEVAKTGAGVYDWTVVEQNVVAHDLLVDGTAMVTATDQGNRRWQVHVNLRPKTSEDVTYSYDLWARRRVDKIVP